MNKTVPFQNTLATNRSASEAEPLVSVIIPVQNEAKTIDKVIKSAKKAAKRTEIIVVCNGSGKATLKKVEKAKVKMIKIREPLGHDVGRALGAKAASGEVLLFIDGDFSVPSQILREFVAQVLAGNDIVLNAYSGVRLKKTIHTVSQTKRIFNRFLSRADLKGSSMTSVPHAISRKALNVIGYADLCVPPKALAKAVLSGLTVVRGPYVDVARKNRRRPERRNRPNPIQRLIYGDHAEALRYLVDIRGERGGFTDFARNRELISQQNPGGVQENPHTSQNNPDEEKVTVSGKQRSLQDVSVIMAASNEENTIGELLRELWALHPLEIIVVDNGSKDRTGEICRVLGAKCLSFPKRIGHDVGRAIGAKEARGDILLFVDGDMVLKAEELRPFIEACAQDADLALNDINAFYTCREMIDDVSMAKRFLNHIIGRPDLGYASLTAVPHAIRKSAVEKIGYEKLAVPPKALVAAKLEGLKIKKVKGINVLTANKVRSINRSSDNPVKQMILGDHIEALNWLQERIGDRGFLADSVRKRQYV